MATAVIYAQSWERLFASLDKVRTNPTDILRAAFATRGHRAIIEKFRDERGPDGKWAPRAASTQARYGDIQAGRMAPPRGFPRAAFNPTNKLLQLTGMLRKSLMPASLSKQTQEIGPGKVMVFSPVPYSGTHDEGDPSRGIPARPFMWLDSKELDDMGTIVLKMALGEA